MRNLRNTQFDRWQVPADLTSVCWDVGRDGVLYTTGPSELSPQIELCRATVDLRGEFSIESIASWGAPPPSPDVAADKIRDLHYFADTSTTCLILAGGDIFLVHEQADGAADPSSSPPGGGGGGAQVEMVGSVESGVAAAAWSPDADLLAAVTGGGASATVVLMSRSFEPVGDASGAAMAAADLALSRHVSVGWGRRETQFKGKGATKAAAAAVLLRDPTIPDKVDAGTLSPLDDGEQVTVSWRGDGAYVAVNSVQALEEEGGGDGGGGGDKRRRVVRVYSRDGVLDSVSEPTDGLEAALSWRPAGNLVAGLQRFADRVDVAFFERNGLRHGGFTLRAPGAERDLVEGPVTLRWNCDSTVLAVVMKGRLQLWTMGNYHWYLKQEILHEGVCASFCWHPEDALRFAAALSDTLFMMECVFVTARGSLTPPHDFGAVAVIDGRTLKVTPFRTANMPPPIAMFELECRSSIIDVAFSPDNSRMAVLYSTGVDLYAWGSKDGRSLRPSLEVWIGLESLVSLDPDALPRQVCLSNDRDILILTSGAEANLLKFEPSDSTTTYTAAPKTHRVLSAAVLHCHGTGGFICQDRRGRLHPLFPQSGSPKSISSMRRLPWFDFFEHDGRLIRVGLSKGGTLYADDRQLAKNCTSFLVTPAHLVFTTSNHLVKFVHLADVEGMEVPRDDPEIDERCRSIERGARLVTAVPTNMSLVLQMPRGNLETISPRAMVVAGIRQLLEQKNYQRAFQFCRTQRVDMNMLYDHRPAQFLENVDLFLDQVKDVTYIDIFLSSLKEEDVAQTTYKDTKESSATVSGNAAKTTGSQCKVNTICDAVLNALKRRRGTHLQNIITAYVCKSPPALEDGLRLVAGLMAEEKQKKGKKMQQQQGSSGSGDNNMDGSDGDSDLDAAALSPSERAMEHVCFLADANRVYDCALGLYDLPLALLAAQQGQRDPREYVPFVRGLADLPSESSRRFQIDDHLGHRLKALGHLRDLDDDAVEAGGEEEGGFGAAAPPPPPSTGGKAKPKSAFDTARAYAARHSLQAELLGLYRGGSPSMLKRRTVLTRDAAAHLEALSRFRPAALAFESLGDWGRAARCYRAAPGCWRECLAAARMQTTPRPQTDAELTELALALVDGLVEAKDYAAAADVWAGDLYFLPPQKRAEDGTTAAGDAVDGSDDDDAAALAAHQTACLDAAIRLLCRAARYSEAIALATSRSRPRRRLVRVVPQPPPPDLLSTAVDAALAEAQASATEFLADCRAQLAAQVPRLAELRRRAHGDPLAFYEGERRGGGELPDDVSVASGASRLSTGASLFTRYTGKGAGASVGTLGSAVSRATSKNRRREEKKRARGRKGTVYEEEYLVNSLRRLVDRVRAATGPGSESATGAGSPPNTASSSSASSSSSSPGRDGEVPRLVEALVRRRMPERAAAVQRLAADVVAACAVAVAEVWPESEGGGRKQQQQQQVNERGQADYYDEEGTHAVVGGAEGVMLDAIEAMRSSQTPPLLPTFEKLALLGD